MGASRGGGGNLMGVDCEIGFDEVVFSQVLEVVPPSHKIAKIYR